MNAQGMFKNRYSLDRRMRESSDIVLKYPDRVPVIVETEKKSSLNLDKSKYLVPKDLTVGQFLFVLRRRMILPPEKALFIYCNKVIPPTCMLMGNMYDLYKEQCGFLYIVVTGENTFGC